MALKQHITGDLRSLETGHAVALPPFCSTGSGKAKEQADASHLSQVDCLMCFAPGCSREPNQRLQHAVTAQIVPRSKHQLSLQSQHKHLTWLLQLLRLLSPQKS